MNTLKKSLLLFGIISLSAFFAGCNMPETNETETMENNEESADMQDNGMDGTEEAMDDTENSMDDSEENMDDAAEAETMDEDVEADVVIDVVGTNYSFSPDRIEVNQGDIVRINFSSDMGFHDWVLEGVEDVATEQVNPGTVTSVTFTAGEPGDYVFYCSVGNHREQGMVGTLVVNGR